ncbi:MAG: lytic transglycosylase domain-containing protein [Pseudomonadota bacterium]
MQKLMTGLVCAALCAPLPAAAELFSSKNKRKMFQSQTRVLDSRASQQYNASVRLQPQSVYTPSKWDLDGFDNTLGRPYQGPYLDVARSAALRHGIPVELFLRLVQQESAWNPRAVSHKGAIGLAQLMPGTAAYLGVNPHDPSENLNGGARYLAEQYRDFGSWRLALAAYNAGPAAVKKHNGIPPYRETQNYVRVILGR